MQITNTVFLVRPASFSYNTQTAASNTFQTKLEETPEKIQAKVLQEFDAFVAKLRSVGIAVQVFEDSTEPVNQMLCFPIIGFPFTEMGQLYCILCARRIDVWNATQLSWSGWKNKKTS